MPLHVSTITWSSSGRFNTGKNQIYNCKRLWSHNEIQSGLVTGVATALEVKFSLFGAFHNIP
jgi:hypothetical protein